MHHWLGHHVKAHVFLCMPRLYVEHHMRNTLAPILFADHRPASASAPRSSRRHQPSPAAIEKRTKRHAADGTPIMAWHDLIAQLGTLTINEVALPLGERRTIQMLARPTALQEHARSARRAAPSCPVADRTSEKECESDQAVMRVQVKSG